MSRPADLHAYLRACRDSSYRPGRFDCALFAAGWVERCTGRDLAAGHAGAYDTLDEGLARLAEAGTDPVRIARAHLEPVGGWMAARPGDIAIIDEDGAPCFGIVGGRYIHVLRPGSGLGVVELSRAVEVLRP